MISIIGFLGVFSAAFSYADLQIKTNDSTSQKILQTLSETDLKASKWLNRQGYRSHLSLKKLIETATAGMSGEENAQIDLLIFQNQAGKKAFMPRWILQRYDVFLAKPVVETSPGLDVVIPRKIFPKLGGERLPLDSYALDSLTSIELTNYKTHYGPFLLKKRSDPAAARGEKLFLQMCMGCHSVHNKVESDSMKTKLEQAEKFQHKQGAGLPFFDEKEVKSLRSYVKALSL